MEKPTPNKAQPSPSKAGPNSSAAPARVPPLFRPVDWIALLICFLAVWGVYLWTLAPDLTLEDSGELCTASFYAGVPHPPGYPFWSLFSYCWTLLPWGSVAWRVEVGESFAAAMACGLVGLMVSRGSSMLIEGIQELNVIGRKWESLICLVCGVTAGWLLGFDSFVWKEAVVINRIALFDVPWLMLVAACLMRWIYAPNQLRYLFISMFFFGLCITVHQTVLCAAMGLEVAIAMARPRYGRTFFLGNSVIYLGIVILMAGHVIPAFNGLAPTLAGILHFVGILSIATYIWLAILTRESIAELSRDGALAAIILFACAFPSNGSVCIFFALLALIAFLFLAWNSRHQDLGWLVVLVCGLVWLLGVSFYLYEPLSCMTDPPMQWAYPRTVQGFFHAISRGQYESANPTNVVGDPLRFLKQLGITFMGVASSFSWVYLAVGGLPFFFLRKMQKRERAWIVGLASIYACVAILLTILMNTEPDLQSLNENKVFLAASHGIIAILIGYGLALLSAYMVTHYERFRRWAFLGGLIAVLLGIFDLWQTAGHLYFGIGGEINFFSLPHWVAQAFAPHQYGLPIYASLFLVAIPLIFLAALSVYRNRAPMLVTLGLFCLMPIYSGLSHWDQCEQRNHWFGYWFGHDMFTPPFKIYKPMARNAILFGGTDPGRFCPTYMIFCESFVPPQCKPMDPNFDRRDVYLITQNALADGTYLEYLRAQYFRSAQVDPPFFHDLILYVGGLFHVQDNSIVIGMANLADHVLDAPLTKWGKDVEDRRRAQGVYPPKEIYIPSDEDLNNAFRDYSEDAMQRKARGELQPGENVQIVNGRVEATGQVTVMMINGILCRDIFDRNPTNEFYVEESFPLEWMYPHETPYGIIMKINRHPLVRLPDDVFKKDHEFWSDYSRRLVGNWVTDRTTVADITNFAYHVYLQHDYSHFHGDFKFLRDQDAQKAFSKLRDSQAGMYAWRLRLLVPNQPNEEQYMAYQPRTEQERMQLYNAADFAFKQAFAFCPYSPEVVVRYANFLFQFGRFDDALMVAQTCHEFDPYNPEITGLIGEIKSIIKQEGASQPNPLANLQQMEAAVQSDPTNVANLLFLGSAFYKMGQTGQAADVFDRVLTNNSASMSDVAGLARLYYSWGPAYAGHFEAALRRLTRLTPNDPETFYDLAAVEATRNETNSALNDLAAAMKLNAQRLKANPHASNLAATNKVDARFNTIRNLPQYRKIMSSQL
ncbi:MAG: DUF2723 domain-containing protein [Verrucomicrobiota bacterium]|nr:DUF2723 domain-containing protein [Verrucomicrobiota bacterium]